MDIPKTATKQKHGYKQKSRILTELQQPTTELPHGEQPNPIDKGDNSCGVKKLNGENNIYYPNIMSGKNRILAVNKRCWYHPNSGGAEKNLKELLSRASDDFQVTLLCGGYPGSEQIESSDGVSIRRVGGSSRPNSILDVIISYFFVTIYFHWYAYKFKPDAVLAVYSPLPWLLISPAPVVVQHHHISIESFQDTHNFPFDYIGSFAQKIGIFLSKDKKVISVSKSTTDCLISYGVSSDNIWTIRNGIDINKYSIGIESELPSIVFIGALKSYKGADRIPAIHQYVQEWSKHPVHLDIAGPSGPEHSFLKEYCAQSDFAQLHGFVSENKKAELLEKAWVAIAPSRIEGYGIIVLEANACGTPVVGSNVPGLRDSIKNDETGLLTSENPGAIAQGVLRLLSDDQLREQLGKNARDWAEEHSWDNSASEFQKLCEEVATR